MPRLFREAAAAVGIDLIDPNAALGRVDVLTAALAAASLTQVAVSETIWKEPLPAPEDAWAKIVASAVGGPVRALDSELHHSARQRFRSAMVNELVRTSIDVQPLLIAIGARA